MSHIIKHCINEYYCNIEELDGNFETIRLQQNTEAEDNDYWLISFSLARWRNKKNLIEYLQKIIEVVKEA